MAPCASAGSTSERTVIEATANVEKCMSKTPPRFVTVCFRPGLKLSAFSRLLYRTCDYHRQGRRYITAATQISRFDFAKDRSRGRDKAVRDFDRKDRLWRKFRPRATTPAQVSRPDRRDR